ncbi:MAG TPA: hypothetical protein VFM46_17190 [Pseudomonadales bacterium]|nr:hypothetical protein [Pseudomonadales bacterium]
MHVLPFLFVLVLSLASCSTLPSVHEQAKSPHLHEQLIDSGIFTHRLFTNEAFSGYRSGPVHVYIEGDGHPWILRHFIAADPTPLHPILLPVFAQDKSAAVYLGRPCYFDLAEEDKRCNSSLWTSARYSENVVKSLLAALQKIMPPGTPVIWIGHSGGGTLATLLAPRYPDTQLVLTFAGNLDIASWTHYHHYTPLNESLDPASSPPLPAGIKQIHFAGSRDTNVLASWIEHYAQRQPNAEFHLIDATHTCCWDQPIQQVLSQFR